MNWFGDTTVWVWKPLGISDIKMLEPHPCSMSFSKLSCGNCCKNHLPMVIYGCRW